MNIAFVASTLPTAFIHKYAARLEIKKVICATRDLVESYIFLMETHTDLRVEALPEGKLRHFFSILWHILGCNKVYFSHECCWPLFDIGLIIARVQSVWFPQSSMNGFRLVCHSELSFLAQIRFFYLNEKRIRPLRSALTVLLTRWFDVYETNSDGGVGFHQCLSLKTNKFSFIERLDETRLVVSKKVSREEGLKTYKVLIACAREPIDDAVQKELYSEVGSIFASKGYRIYVKDHPNEAGRLGFVYPGSQVIPARLPIECVSERFDFVVGVASCALVRSNMNAISLLKLLPFPDPVALSRLKTLAFFENFSDVKFVESIQEINEIIDSTLPF